MIVDFDEDLDYLLQARETRLKDMIHQWREGVKDISDEAYGGSWGVIFSAAKGKERNIEIVDIDSGTEGCSDSEGDDASLSDVSALQVDDRILLALEESNLGKDRDEEYMSDSLGGSVDGGAPGFRSRSQSPRKRKRVLSQH